MAVPGACSPWRAVMENQANEAVRRRMAWAGYARRAGHGRLRDHDRDAALVAAAVVAATRYDVSVRVVRESTVLERTSVVRRAAVGGWPALIRRTTLVRRDTGLAAV